MSYFRKTGKAKQWFDMLSKDQKWLILINADPDAMAAAMALRRMLTHKGVTGDIARINDISRPDNLAMIRYVNLHMRRFQPAMLDAYNRFAIVDSQPAHNPQFAGISFSTVIDHHPVVTPADNARFQDIKPEYGATSTMLTEYLYNLGIKPGARLATALQYGIRTDTMHFQRNTKDVDMRAYQYLNRFADQSLLTRIMRSEFRIDWLPYMAKAIEKLRSAGSGCMAYLGAVESPDILVLIADFFTRVYEIRWLAVAGIYEKTAVMVFRGDGISRDVGKLALEKFNQLGSAGGHKTMARAEFPANVSGDEDLETFLHRLLVSKLSQKSLSKITGQQETAQQPATQPQLDVR